MANIRINALPTTATSTASDDFLGIDGTTNGTRKMAARTPVFNSVTGNATTDLTLAGGSSGASLVLGQGTNGGATLTPKGTGVATIAGPTSITDATDASSSTTGSLKTAGGLGVAKKLHVGSTINAVGQLTLSFSNPGCGIWLATGTATNQWFIGGSDLENCRIYSLVAGNNVMDFGGTLAAGVARVNYTTDSSNNSTGALVIGGGMGIGKKLYVGDNIVGAGSISTSSTTDSSSTTTGALVVSGGVGIAKKLYVGSTINAVGQLTLSYSNPGAGIWSDTPTATNQWFIGTTSTESYRIYSLVAGNNVMDFGGTLAAGVARIGYTTDSSSATTGALTVSGGVGIAKKLYVGDNIVGAGSVTTAAPTSGTAKAWKLGEVASVSPTSPNRTIRVEIDGTVYYISAKTTND